MTAMWTCPACDRKFGKARQSHTCLPTVSEAEYFETRQSYEREVFGAVRDALAAEGRDVEIEFATVGVFFKRSRTFAELRPKPSRRCVAMSLILSEPVDDPRVKRVVRWGVGGSRTAYFFDLHDASDVDHDLAGWILESWDECG
jgi:predicted transport protein